jgi:GNAT superfamily N-acetyltransferase
MTPPVGVRRATASDHQLVASIITRAFADDPLWSRALARPDGATEHQAEFWGILVEGALRYPWTWLAEGDAATAIWIPPDEVEVTPPMEERIVELAHRSMGDDAGTLLELLDRFEEAHPRDEPHYYLSLLGTHPAHRGRGIGMAMLAQTLDLIDDNGMPAYLESSNPDNDRRYAGVGFEPVGAFSFPDGGPVVTTMWRPAR